MLDQEHLTICLQRHNSSVGLCLTSLLYLELLADGPRPSTENLSSDSTRQQQSAVN